MNWIELSVEDKINVLETLKVKLKLDTASIEKDWWVTIVLKALFASEFAPHLSFKGGTSLSKCFHLINRFSEDVDIAVNREFLGFSGELSKTQVSDRLRRASCSFVRETLSKGLEKQLLALGRFSAIIEQIPTCSTGSFIERPLTSTITLFCT